jgi:arylsulfatase A-like enzyme
VKTKNKLLITIDGIRKDRVGVYNSASEYLTPNLTRIARESVVFDDMVAAATSTGMCFPSIFTGRYQYEFGRRTYGDTKNPFFGNVFTDHEELGYRTIVCLNKRFDIHHRLINAFGKAEHWWTGESSGDNKKDSGSLSPCEQADYLINRLKDINTPVFVWMHLWGFGKPEDRFLDRTTFDYDARVAELDEAIGVLFRQFSHNSEFFFFSDHGYSFFEHGKWSYGKDGSNVTESVCSVPAIVFNGHHTGRNKNLVSQICMREIVRDSSCALSTRSEIAFCETRYVGQDDKVLAVRKGPWKLVCHFLEDRIEFYDLHTDPHENIDLASDTFHKLTRDKDGQHPPLKPYVIRTDWETLRADRAEMEDIAKLFYGEVKLPMAGLLKRWIKRQKVLAPIVRLARRVSWKFQWGAQKV